MSKAMGKNDQKIVFLMPFDEKGFIYLGDNTIIHKDNLIKSFDEIDCVITEVQNPLPAIRIVISKKQVKNGL